MVKDACQVLAASTLPAGLLPWQLQSLEYTLVDVPDSLYMSWAGGLG